MSENLGSKRPWLDSCYNWADLLCCVPNGSGWLLVDLYTALAGGQDVLECHT